MRVATTSAFVFNVCTGKATSVRSLAQTMAELCGTELAVHHRPARCGEVRTSIGDPQRALERLGFAAQTRLSDGLAMTLDLLGRSSELEAQVVA